MNDFKAHFTGRVRKFDFGEWGLVLPEMAISRQTGIYILNVLSGEPEMIHSLANQLVRKLNLSARSMMIPIEVVVTPETKAITLAFAVASIMGLPLVVLRKEEKAYLGENPPTATVVTYTSHKRQSLVLDRKDIPYIQDRTALFVDDVVSTASTLDAAIGLVSQVGGTIVYAAVLAVEGDPKVSVPLISLTSLPLTRLL